MKIVLSIAIAIALSSCETPLRPANGAEAKSTTASFYWRGQRVACPGYGRFNPDGLTAAARPSAKLPCGTRIEVTNTKNGKSVVVTVTDRCPCRRGRDLDLSRGAARLIGMVRAGVVPVTYRVLAAESTKDEPKPAPGPVIDNQPTFGQRFKGCFPWVEQC